MINTETNRIQMLHPDIDLNELLQIICIAHLRIFNYSLDEINNISIGINNFVLWLKSTQVQILQYFI